MPSLLANTPHETAQRIIAWAASQPVGWVYVSDHGIHFTDIPAKMRFITSLIGPQCVLHEVRLRP